MRQTSMSDRFWSKVAIREPEDCWIWTAGVDNHGYGNFWVSDEVGTVRSHRMAMLLNGHDPGVLCVCHRCDTPLCCNPAHLFAGTNHDNSSDRDSKGRVRFGEGSGRAKLTTAQVKELRALHLAGWTHRALADRFRLSTGTVHKIIHRIYWRHVT